ncbi:MAG: GlsB/YeaQ/YmgE family stress response membrane protein [Deltaproteobacteria bacterium]|nr:GlsB/YeaQ/YmgE family stress response membrane protein [Deltaproteobacteria bacterium]
MGLCGWIMFGFLAGLLARAITPGDQKMGFIATTLLGIAGSFAGGMLAALINHESPMVLQTSGIIGAVIGGIALLVLGRALSRPRA